MRVSNSIKERGRADSRRQEAANNKQRWYINTMTKRRNDENRKYAVVGIFSYLDDLLSTLKALDKSGFKVDTIFSPVFHHEIKGALRLKPSPVRYFTLFGGVLGILAMLSVAIYAHLQWKLITGGKPVVPWIPFIIVAFEGCILIGFLSTLVGMMIKNRMPRFCLPKYYDPRFTQDRYGVVVACNEAEEKEVSKLMKEAGAEEVHAVKG